MKRKVLVLLMLSCLLILTACGSATEASVQESPKTEASVQESPKTEASMQESPKIEESVPAIVESTPIPTLKIKSHVDAVYVGEEIALGTDYEGEVVWASSDESVAAIDGNGNLKALSAGAVTISASPKDYPDVIDETSLIVGAHVEQVTIKNEEIVLMTGSDKATAPLEASVLPETALETGLRYESSDPAVVEVDEKGELHAVAPGSAQITVTAVDEACQTPATCAITVKQGVSTITLNETEKDLYTNEKLVLTASIEPADAEDNSVTWSTSDSSVATVDAKGIVQPVGVGTATILCTANDGSEVAGKCEVKVVVGVQKITLDNNKVTLFSEGPAKLGQAKLSYTLEPKENSFPDVEWSSSNEAVVKVAKDGTLTAVAPGKATVIATSTDPKTAGRVKAVCNVTVGNAVKSIGIEWGGDTIAKGTTRKLIASITPKDALKPALQWKTSNEKVLTVDANGNIRALSVGSATITCTTTDGTEILEKHDFKVIQAVTSVTANERGTILLFGGKTTNLHVTVAPADATNKAVDWKSNDSSIATVDSSGQVKAKNAGVTYITATSKDGSGRFCIFNILVEPALPITIDSLGFGVYNANLLGITVKNYCSRTAIKNFDFTIALYTYDGTKLSSSGSYSLGSDETIAAGATRTIRRTLSGVSWAQKIVITITGVKLGDGSYYDIPLTYQETWTFSR